RVLYTGRSRNSMPLPVELPEDADVFVPADSEYGAPRADEPSAGRRGGTTVSVSGPAPLASRVEALVAEEAPVSCERIAAAPIIDGRPFEVQLGRSSPVLPVSEDESVLDVLQRVRPDTPCSCRQGFCGTCRVGLLEGTPEHRDRPTGGSSRGSEFATCVSRAGEGERIVLDL